MVAQIAIETVRERLGQVGSDLHEAITKLLDHSSLRYYDINANSGGAVFLGWHSWRWAELDPDGRPLVKPARDLSERWQALCESAIRSSAPEREEVFAKLQQTINRVIQQPDDWTGAPADSIEKVREIVARALAAQIEILDELPSAHGVDERIIVADTSALLDRPDLQAWKLDGKAWTVVAVPQVLAELDDRKRDPRTRDAANKVIRQLDDFDRRGNTLVGVPIAGRLAYREVAHSPEVAQVLPWLRADVPDDHIIAAAVELAWQNLNARLAVLASDRNVRNKARIAGLSTLSPTSL